MSHRRRPWMDLHPGDPPERRSTPRRAGLIRLLAANARYLDDARLARLCRYVGRRLGGNKLLLYALEGQTRDFEQIEKGRK